MKKTNLILQILLLPFDYIAVLGALISAYYLRDYFGSAFLMPVQEFIRVVLVLSIVWLLTYAVLGLYSRNIARASLDEFVRVFIGSAGASLLAGSLIFLSKQIEFSRLILGLGGILSVLFVQGGRVILGLFGRLLHRLGYGVTRVLIVGDNGEIGSIIDGFKIEADPKIKLVGVITDLFHKGREVAGVSIVGGFSDLERIINELAVDEIILADANYSEDRVLGIVNLCQGLGLKFKFIPSTFETVTAIVRTDEIAGYPVIELRSTVLEGAKAVVKRALDILISSLALLLLTPLLLLTALAIKLDSPGTILYRHRRVGQGGKKFDLLKFRSMYMLKKGGQLVHASENKAIEKLKEQQGNYKLEDDPRITRVGRIIRKLSIDELPQLWNVLRGEMSIVGPRPYIERELDKRATEYEGARELIRRVLLVKPGITGLWQVSGRSNIDFSERIAMDAYYVTHASLWMDMKFILKTIPAVLRGRGAM